MFLMLFFGVHLKWLPVAGYVFIYCGREQGILEHLRYLLLPALSLGVVQAAYITRMSRSAAGCIVYELSVQPGQGPEGICCGPGLRTENAGPTILTVVGQSLAVL